MNIDITLKFDVVLQLWIARTTADRAEAMVVAPTPEEATRALLAILRIDGDIA